ncbi:MAG: hypothetical protein Q7S61_03380 [bacterium]|nr:hypothetical protein [bacterium]
MKKIIGCLIFLFVFLVFFSSSARAQSQEDYTVGQKFIQKTTFAENPAVPLDPNRFAMFYLDQASQKMNLKIATISGNIITDNQPYEATKEAGLGSMTALSPNKLVIVASNFAQIATVEGTNVTFGPSFPLENMYMSSSVFALNDHAFVTCYRKSTDAYHAFCSLGTVTDTTIGFPSKNIPLPSWGYEFSFAKIDDQSFLISYSDNTNRVKIVLATFVNNTLRFVSAADFMSESNRNSSVVMLDKSTFVVGYTTYRSNANPWEIKSYVRIGKISSSTELELNPEIEISSNNASYVSLLPLSNNLLLTGYSELDRVTSTYTGKIRLLRLNSDNSIALGKEYQFDSGQMLFISLARLSTDTFLIKYWDNDTGSLTSDLSYIVGAIQGVVLPEYTPFPAPILTTTPMTTTACKTTIGDTNCDGKIDDEDFKNLIRSFLKSFDKTSDFNNDGKSNLLDFEIWRRNRF